MRFFLLILMSIVLMGSSEGNSHKRGNQSNYLSPGNITVDKKRDMAYTVLTTSRSVAVTNMKSGEAVGIIELKQNPNDLLLSPDGMTLYVSNGEEEGRVDIIGLPGKKRKASIKVGHTPQGLTLSGDGKTLYVANRFSNTISVIDLSRNKETTTIPVTREPRNISLTPDGKTLAVANFLPAVAATETVVAAEITLIDARTNTVRTNLTLENGAQSVLGTACSADGKYLYAVHLLSQFNTLITQLEKGWVNTNALSIIDLEKESVYATVLLDDVDNGAANPAGICLGDDKKLYITLSGTHELMVLDLPPLHEKLEKLFMGRLNDLYIKDKADLITSLSFAYPYKKRYKLQGRSPRAVVYHAGTPLVSCRFGTFLEKPAMTKGDDPVIISLGTESLPDAVRRGELAFSDASICYQQWQSCASCHPDGRADGLNWDQENDGFGNPKNTKSLLFSHVTPPSMITGIRKTAEMAVRNGIIHTLQTRQPDEVACDMDAYLKELVPAESPYLKEYKKKDPRQRGRAIYEKAGCIQCHKGAYYTDLKKYNVRTGSGNEENTAFDTPALKELWRTAPYLYDGRATSLKEVFTTFNPDNRHGITKDLSEEDLDALILYLNTL